MTGWHVYADTAHSDDADRAADTAAALLAADDARWARVRNRHDTFTMAHVLSDAAAERNPDALRADRTFWEQATVTDPQAAPMLAELRGRGCGSACSPGRPGPRPDTRTGCAATAC